MIIISRSLPSLEAIRRPPFFFLLQFVKRDTIREIEKEVQRRWEKERIFEIDAPKVGDPYTRSC